MLAAYHLGNETQTNFDAIEARIRRWVTLSQSRTTCDDAYSDLLMAAVEYGSLVSLIQLESDLRVRGPLMARANALMSDLVVYSHALREACRPCKIR